MQETQNWISQISTYPYWQHWTALVQIQGYSTQVWVKQMYGGIQQVTLRRKHRLNKWQLVEWKTEKMADLSC